MRIYIHAEDGTTKIQNEEATDFIEAEESTPDTVGAKIPFSTNAGGMRWSPKKE